MRRYPLPVRRGTLLLAAVLAGAAAPVGAQVLPGPEIAISTPQFPGGTPAVASIAGGGFVAAWRSGTTVVARRLDANGIPQGAEIVVAAGAFNPPVVAGHPTGRFLVAWLSAAGIMGRLYEATGVPASAETLLVAGASTPPRVSASAPGYVAVWTTGNPAMVSARLFDPQLAPRTGVLTVAQGSAADVACRSDGSFFVGFSFDDPVSYWPYLKVALFDANGTLANLSTAAIGTGSLPYADMPRVAEGGGTAVVAWHNWSYMCGGGAMMWCTFYDNGTPMRRIDAAGNPLGSVFNANVHDAGAQKEGAVAVLPSGQFVAAWSSSPVVEGCTGFPSCWPPPPLPPPQDGSGAGVYGRLFDASGADIGGGEFRVNVTTAGDQVRPAIAADASGFLVVFESAGAILGRRYATTLVPAALEVDPTVQIYSDGNRVFENWEAVVVAPSWRNTTGSAQAVTSTASTFTGPPAAAYDVVIGSAVYGSMAPGATVSCQQGGQCFLLTLYANTRPAAHWDARFTETLAGAPAPPKTWTLHVGDSFADVPRASPYYRFVETVFHNDVMAGCGTGVFCPTDGISRQAMALFVLKAANPAFTPPACVAGGELFLDVPSWNPYCPWVEELARRGVVAGCGGGNYCPTLAVSRETMAVYLLRTKEGTAYTPPACTVPVFADVPASSPFCRWIEELARRGVVGGCAPGFYCPTRPVPRDHMSVFLTGTFALMLYAP